MHQPHNRPVDSRQWQPHERTRIAAAAVIATLLGASSNAMGHSASDRCRIQTGVDAPTTAAASGDAAGDGGRAVTHLDQAAMIKRVLRYYPHARPDARGRALWALAADGTPRTVAAQRAASPLATDP